MLGEETDESVELPTCVLPIVAAPAALSFAFVRQEVLDDCIDQSVIERWAWFSCIGREARYRWL